MFGIGLPELILILGLALIVVGPEKLPELAKSIAKGVLELKKAAGTLKDSIQEETEDKPWERVPPIEYPGADNLADSLPEVKKTNETVPNEDPVDGGTDESGEDDSHEEVPRPDKPEA